ncbi:MAG: MFS transporter [Betaproteobacteria bacterium]|nr:MFS transporter [Betaproteobacteria bacterium]MDE2124371.1 MFS transporter [Betaproteobacteria bacterium]MDE2187499.1 MFS transporter [Betaproteobacteria bacterium]MDE2323287.1 MFS transporter [Betaproteobacteria bacterium]
MGARFGRSLGQGALVVGFSLYLHALNWSAASIGAVLSAGLLLGVVLTLLIGPASDRLGRKQFLLAYEGVLILSALLALASSATWVLTLGAVLGGFGRGANGAAGPFGPLEQAWLAQGLLPAQRSRVFSLNSALGFFGMALGALLAGLPALWSGLLPGALAYRPLFVLPLLGSAIGLVLIWRAPDAKLTRPKPPLAASTAVMQEDDTAFPTLEGNGPPATPDTSSADAEATRDQAHSATHAEENRMLWRLGLANSLNGLGIGLVAPLMAYWFLRRFGHGPATIGPALAASFVLAAVGAQFAQRFVPRYGVVRTVVGMRAVGLLLMVLTPFMPVFILAAGSWAIRSAFNQGTLGVRQALTMGLTRQHRQGLAATVNNVSIQVPRAIGPAIAGLMLHQGWLTAPFILAAGFQLAYLVAYQRFFGGMDRPRG